MDSVSYKTYYLNSLSEERWWILDAKDKTLGRVSSRIAIYLQGKYRPQYAPNREFGDRVIVINASHILLTGKKWENKKHYWYTGYPGGRKSISLLELKKKFSPRILEKSIKGMLPKNRLGRKIFKELHVFSNNVHPYQKENIQSLPLKDK